MQGFRASINLQFDLPDPQLLERYLLTSAHAEVINGLLTGARAGREAASRAHLLIGPYGTGKSLLATIVCQLFSRRFPEAWFERLRAQAERIDTRLADQIRGYAESELTYIPVLINGRAGQLRSIVNQAVHRALHQAGIAVSSPNEASTILRTVERWREFYPDTYEAFRSHLSARGVEEEAWRSQIENCQEEPIRAFAAFYPSVTAGTPWTIEHETYFLENLEQLSAELSARGIGLFIVYDEFGRFLQALGGQDTLSNMQDLQNLAEFINHTPNMHLLLVGHKHIRQYAANSRESVRAEFEKVEKRFRSYYLENDSATFLRLAQEATANRGRLTDGEEADREKIGTLQSFPLFAGYTSYQLERGIVADLYPLHPVAVVLLPQLSNIFGQNERTLFSFLTNNEPYSLTDHIGRQGGYYYADRLFDFFGVADADSGDLPGLQLYLTIAPYLDERQPLLGRIAKLLTLWSVTRLTSRQPATTAFLASALGVEAAVVEAALEQLTEAKVVRFNAIRDYWELYDGSSIDLNAIIANKALTTSLRESDTLELLEQHLPIAHIVPYEYNDDMDMLRYADVRFESVNGLRLRTGGGAVADDRIWLVVYANEEEMDTPAELASELDPTYLVGFPKFTMQSVASSLLHYRIIQQLQQDPAFLARDARLKSELSYMLQETGERIGAFVRRYFAFEELSWYSEGRPVPIKELRGLELEVTRRLRHTYRRTPRIRNEAFNRNRISSVQRRALIDVIDRVIRRPEAPDLGIEGFGPNYLIYATALKRNEYSMDAEGRLSCNGELGAIREELLRRLQERPIGRLSDLVGMMEAPPYGIRSAVVPLLFVALLRDRWDQLFFYAHDMLTTHLSGSSVLELVELADAYEYRYYDWSPEEKMRLEALGRSFALPADESLSFLHVSAALVRWLRSLPKFAQITRQLSPVTLAIRDHIRSSEIDPYLHLKRISEFGDETLAEAKRELEQFAASNREELREHVLALTGKLSLDEIGEAVERRRGEALGSNSKLQTLPARHDGADAVDALAVHLVGVEREEWSDATQELFLSQIQYEWQLLLAGDVAVAASEAETSPAIPLSKKAQTVYVNVKNMLKYAGKDVPEHEVRQLLLRLLQEL